MLKVVFTFIQFNPHPELEEERERRKSLEQLMQNSLEERETQDKRAVRGNTKEGGEKGIIFNMYKLLI